MQAQNTEITQLLNPHPVPFEVQFVGYIVLLERDGVHESLWFERSYLMPVLLKTREGTQIIPEPVGYLLFDLRTEKNEIPWFKDFSNLNLNAFDLIRLKGETGWIDPEPVVEPFCLEKRLIKLFLFSS
jgi:hypothetical protein